MYGEPKNRLVMNRIIASREYHHTRVRPMHHDLYRQKAKNGVSKKAKISCIVPDIRINL
jgi:hypothetical protein